MGYPNGSGIALLDGTLKLRYYTFPFAGRRPTWKLPTPGHVADVLTTGGENDGLFGVEPPGGSRGGAGFVRQSFKRVRLAKKTRCPIVSGEGRGREVTVRYSQSLQEGAWGVQPRGQAGSGRDWLNMFARKARYGTSTLPGLSARLHKISGKRH